MPADRVVSFNQLTSNDAGQLVVLDTSFVYEVYGQSKYPNLQRQCQNFVIDAARHDVILATTIKTQEELRIVATRDLVHQDPQQRKAILTSNPTGAMQPVDQLISQINAQLSALPNYYPEPLGSINSATLQDAHLLMLTHGLEFPDAVISAISLANGADGLATLDGDLTRVAGTGLTIWTSARRHREWLSQNGVGPAPTGHQVLGLPILRSRPSTPGGATGTGASSP